MTYPGTEWTTCSLKGCYSQSCHLPNVCLVSSVGFLYLQATHVQSSNDSYIQIEILECPKCHFSSCRVPAKLCQVLILFFLKWRPGDNFAFAGSCQVFSPLQLPSWVILLCICFLSHSRSSGQHIGLLPSSFDLHNNPEALESWWLKVIQKASSLRGFPPRFLRETY